MDLREAAFQHLLSLLPPGRRPREGGAAWGVVWALGGLEGRLLQELFALLAEAFPHRASEEGLAQHGKARSLRRYNETAAAYAARLTRAIPLWQMAGTVPGVLAWLEAAGYDAFIYEHFRDDPAIWAEFSVWLWPRVNTYITDRWNDGLGSWDDGTPWDYQLSAAELSRVPAILREAKPAHSKVRNIYYIPGPKDAWDDGQLWDDGGVWAPEPQRIA